MTVVIIIVAVLVIGYLLYLGNKKRQVEAARKREQLGAQAELDRAERHAERAAEVDPDVEAEETRSR